MFSLNVFSLSRSSIWFTRLRVRRRRDASLSLSSMPNDLFWKLFLQSPNFINHFRSQTTAHRFSSSNSVWEQNGICYTDWNNNVQIVPRWRSVVRIPWLTMHSCLSFTIKLRSAFSLQLRLIIASQFPRLANHGISASLNHNSKPNSTPMSRHRRSINNIYHFHAI